MKPLLITLLALAAMAPTVGASARPDPDLPAASWAPADTADTLWRRGRVAIADEDWRRAAVEFRDLARRFPRSAYAGDALYWQAFALQRLGGRDNLRTAVAALEDQRARYPQSATVRSGESGAMLTRLNGRLARSGDSEAAMVIAEQAAELGTAVAAAVAPVAAEVSRAVSAEMARVAPEINREVNAAMREQAAAAREQARAARGRDRDDDIPAECEEIVTDQRIEALNALMQMNSDQALPILRRVLARREKCSEYLRRKAVFIVSQRRTDEAADILTEVARNDPDMGTRREAVFWLSQTNSDRAVTVLEQILLRDPRNDELQKRAIFSLSQTRSPRAGEILRDYARRTDAPDELRSEAIFWIGQMRGETSSAFLRELFPTLQTNELRERVLFSVAQRRNPEDAQWLVERAKDTRLSIETRKQALFWAGQAGVGVADLAAIYDNARTDRELREAVIFSLSQRRNNREAIDKLISIVRTEQDPELRRQATFWVGQSRDPRAAALLEELINKP